MDAFGEGSHHSVNAGQEPPVTFDLKLSPEARSRLALEHPAAARFHAMPNEFPAHALFTGHF